jgi:hypothetical protein
MGREMESLPLTSRTARCSLFVGLRAGRRERRQARGGMEYSSLALAARFLRQPKLSTHASENLEAVSLSRACPIIKSHRAFCRPGARCRASIRACTRAIIVIIML